MGLLACVVSFGFAGATLAQDKPAATPDKPAATADAAKPAAGAKPRPSRPSPTRGTRHGCWSPPPWC